MEKVGTINNSESTSKRLISLAERGKTKVKSKMSLIRNESGGKIYQYTGHQVRQLSDPLKGEIRWCKERYKSQDVPPMHKSS